MGELRWLILRFPIIRDRPEPVESAPRRLATMAYGHSTEPARGAGLCSYRGMRQVRRESLTPPAYEADVMAGTSFAPPHGLVICGPGVRAQLVPRVGYSTASAAARGPDRHAAAEGDRTLNS